MEQLPLFVGMDVHRGHDRSSRSRLPKRGWQGHKPMGTFPNTQRRWREGEKTGLKNGVCAKAGSGTFEDLL